MKYIVILLADLTNFVPLQTLFFLQSRPLKKDLLNGVNSNPKHSSNWTPGDWISIQQTGKPRPHSAPSLKNKFRYSRLQNLLNTKIDFYITLQYTLLKFTGSFKIGSKIYWSILKHNSTHESKKYNIRIIHIFHDDDVIKLFYFLKVDAASWSGAAHWLKKGDLTYFKIQW